MVKNKGGVKLIKSCGPNDVVLGKGNGINMLPGNKLFRKIIERFKPEYAEAVRSQKSLVADQVLDVMTELKPPARFLDPRGEHYVTVSEKRQREKICQALREKKVYVSRKASNTNKTEKPQNSETEKTKGSKGGNKKVSLSLTVPSPPSLPPPTSFPPPIGFPRPLPPSENPRKAFLLPAPSLSLIKSARLKARADRSPATPTSSKIESQKSSASIRRKVSLPTSNLKKPSSKALPLQQEQASEQLQPNDVLLGGRGRKNFGRPANQRYSARLRQAARHYVASIDKRQFAIDLYHSWEGRFLSQDACGNYQIMTQQAVLEKMCQAFRDYNKSGMTQVASTFLAAARRMSQEAVPVTPPPSDIETATILTQLGNGEIH